MKYYTDWWKIAKIPIPKPNTIMHMVHALKAFSSMRAHTRRVININMFFFVCHQPCAPTPFAATHHRQPNKPHISNPARSTKSVNWLARCGRYRFAQSFPYRIISPRPSHHQPPVIRSKYARTHYIDTHPSDKAGAAGASFARVRARTNGGRPSQNATTAPLTHAIRKLCVSA